MKTIIVPCDGASNIKISCYNFDDLSEIESYSTNSPSAVIDGMNFNSTIDEFEWFDQTISSLSKDFRNVAVISSVSRGASGGLIGKDGKLIDCKTGKHTLAYTHAYSKITDQKFCEICGDEKEFFIETGSISTLPGSLTLIKRFLFEALERSDLAERAESFAIYSALMSGHFLGDNYLLASKVAGNEYSYWMCHSGTKNISTLAPAESSICDKIHLYKKLVTSKQVSAYKKIGIVPESLAKKMRINSDTMVLPGGHDTSFSHIPVTTSFYQYFNSMKDTPFIHLEVGTWIMCALIGGSSTIKKEFFGKGIISQGSVDGKPILTSMYAGGSDFKYLKKLAEDKGLVFECKNVIKVLKNILLEKNCFVLPNINPANRGHGPFPDLVGKIVNEKSFFSSGENAFIVANLMSAIVSSYHIGLISNEDSSIPIVITGGGAKNSLFGELVSTLTKKDVFTMYGKGGLPLVETTSLGSAIIGKAGCLNVHPYSLDISNMGVSFRKSSKLDPYLTNLLDEYSNVYFKSMSAKN